MASRVQSSVGDLATTLQQRGGKIVKAVNDQMMIEMKKVQQVAKSYAPVDHGNLEDAIKIISANRRRSWTVYVDESMPDDTGKYTVGDYAMRIHEGIGWEKLGQKSLEKMAVTGYVGRKYLEKAFQEAINSGMVERLAEMARQYGISNAP